MENDTVLRTKRPRRYLGTFLPSHYGLSNFVADAPRVVGFDPFARLADYLEGL